MPTFPQRLLTVLLASHVHVPPTAIRQSVRARAPLSRHRRTWPLRVDASDTNHPPMVWLRSAASSQRTPARRHRRLVVWIASGIVAAADSGGCLLPRQTTTTRPTLRPRVTACTPLKDNSISKVSTLACLPHDSPQPDPRERQLWPEAAAGRREAHIQLLHLAAALCRVGRAEVAGVAGVAAAAAAGTAVRAAARGDALSARSTAAGLVPYHAVLQMLFTGQSAHR